ncbi:LOW QUALITY PROTEIN: uncharacterized protein LOC112576210 [Pomacea canaliculata]|uniref:LOW QUALITY PROTEIN: uncharacterized protein LOC112576210 n=1 Tax=Pomacea canaliculata TaxID=400727 RepID=UPI000D731B8A|nr:LOW QUALITY PROTEIN: uncharacterized protein LOC112576210 [Pomacea canaliculata]
MVKEKVKKHNENVLAALRPGDLVSFKRKIYSHWGVYVGNEEVIHLRGNHDCKVSEQIFLKLLASMMGKIFSKVSICKEKFMDVAGETKRSAGTTWTEKLIPVVGEEQVDAAVDSPRHSSLFWAIAIRTTSPVFSISVWICIGEDGDQVLEIAFLFEPYPGKQLQPREYRPIALSCYDPDEIVRRAESKLGEMGYHVCEKNCEHFATWCRYGVAWSDQVSQGYCFCTLGISFIVFICFILTIYFAIYYGWPLMGKWIF